MEPLQAISMPGSGVLVGLTVANSWQAGTVLFAYVATNSTQRLSFVSLQRGDDVVAVASRPAAFEDMPYGVVIEVHRTKALAEGETVYVSLAQAGAMTYYPPQPIDDSPQGPYLRQNIQSIGVRGGPPETMSRMRRDQSDG